VKADGFFFKGRNHYRYVAQNDQEPVLPLEEAVVLLKEAEEERKTADQALKNV